MPGSADLASEHDVSHVPTARAHGLCAVIVGKALFFLRLYLFYLRESAHEQEGKGEGEAGSLLGKEPYMGLMGLMGLDPRTWRS